MNYNFCTLFDRNYLYKGLVLYNSLLRCCQSFKLWILCFDEETFNILKKMDLMNVVLITLRDFEDKELLKIKETRTPVEYYWTSTPSLLLYMLKREPTIDMLSYLDADLFFYSDPLPIYEEFGSDSILIVKHNYSEKYKKYEKLHGKYNVQFLIFRNDTNSLECLSWWRNKCIEWCYLKYEDNKWGDQKYLDDWTERFEGVHVLRYEGAGVAPWNVEKYSLRKANGKLYIDNQRLIFYHFHQLNIISQNKYDLSRGYFLSQKAIELIYKPYIYQINEIIKAVAKKDSSFNYGYNLDYLLRPSSIATTIKSIILRNKFFKNCIRKSIGNYIGKNYYLYQIK